MVLEGLPLTFSVSLKVCPNMDDRTIDEVNLCCRGSVDGSVNQSTLIDQVWTHLNRFVRVENGRKL
jgi:hypothetical protein